MYLFNIDMLYFCILNKDYIKMDQLTNDDFKQLLKKAELNKKDLCEILKTSYQGVNNWGTNGRDYPYWVKSWLENYIKAKTYDDIKDKVFEIEKIEKL